MRKFISLFTALLIATPIYAQDLVGTNKQWEISDFSGGLATNVTDIKLDKKYATVCENVRLESERGTLTKRDDIKLYGTADTTEANTSLHRLYLSDATKVLLETHGNELETGADATGDFTTILDLTSSGYKWQWLTWHDLAIGCDGQSQPVKTNGTLATYLGTCAGVDSGAGSGPAAGTYSYKVAFYTATYTVIFGVASATVTNGVGDHDITLSMIPIGPDTYGGEDVVGRKIYRSDAGAAANWELLSGSGDTGPGTITNNTTTSVTDSDLDAAKSGAYPTHNGTTVFTWTPPKGELSCINNNRLFFANDPTNGPSRVYYSEAGTHDCFNSTANYFEIRKNDGDEITFIKNQLGVLTVGKNNTIQKLDTEGDDPSADWEISDPYSHIGCAAPYSAVNTPIGIIYLSRDGLYKFNGQNSTLLSDSISDIIDDISPSNFINSWGVLHKNVYSLAYTSKSAGTSNNNRVLRYDLISESFSIDTLNIACFGTFNSGTDWGALYAGSSTDGKVYTYEAVALEITHKLHSDFTGTWDDMRYIPEGIPGGDSESPILEIA